MVDTIKFSQMASGGDLAPDEKTPGLLSGANVLFNNPFPLLAPGTTGDRPVPAPSMYYRLRFNTDLQAYEYYTPILASWIQLVDSAPSLNGPFITYTTDPTLPNAQNLGALANGLIKQSVALGVATIAIAIKGTDYYGPGQVSPIPIADGGTGANNANDARLNLGLGTMAQQDANNVNITGGSAALTSGSVLSAPIAPTDLVNKAYADTIASGFQFKGSCLAATTADVNATYNNGASGVGATLICNVNGASNEDGVALSLNDRVLVKDQVNTTENGIYLVSVVGDGSTPFTWTRATDFDTPTEIATGSITFIQDGATYANTSFVETEVVTLIGTSPILFIQFSQTYPLSMGNGGTGANITPVVNSVVYSTASNMALIPPTNNGVLVYSAGGVPSSSTTLPSGLTIPGFAHSGANSDITSMTGLTGKLQAPTAIASSTGLDVVGFTYTASAVNNLNIANTITRGDVRLSSVGSDTNIGMSIYAKGTDGVSLYSEGANAFGVGSGTAYQHLTQYVYPTTAATRTVTWPDKDGTVAYTNDISMTLVASGTAANSTSVNLTGMTGFTNYMVFYYNYTPVTSGSDLIMRVSTNNGSSYQTTAYRGQLTQFAASTLATASFAPVSAFTLLSNVNNTAGVSWFGTVNIPNPAGGAFFCAQTNGYYVNPSLTQVNQLFSGQWTSTTVVNAIQFLTTSGNISTGTFYLYGIK